MLRNGAETLDGNSERLVEAAARSREATAPPTPTMSRMPNKNRTRRTPEQMIADLQAEIERVKARAAQAKVKKDPALRHISAAVRSIDKAARETTDPATRTALNEARATLAGGLALSRAVPHGGAGTLTPRPRAAAPPDADRVLAYIRKHPGSRSEEICGKLGTSAASLRAVLHRLRDERRVKVEGKARATRYTAV